MLVAGLLLRRLAIGESNVRHEVSSWKDKHSVFIVVPRHADRPAFNVVALMNIIPRRAQKTAPLLVIM